MNVIIANKQQSLLQGLNIDIIKSVVGEFDVEQIVNNFRNFYYQRMILDITAIKNYQDIRVLQKLSISLDMDKVILLLDGSEESGSAGYLSKLISMGIYNFTKNAEGILYLYQNPNSYRDVAQYHQIDNQTMDSVGSPAMPVQEIASGVRIIGIRNIADSAGATTLAYLMVRQLQKNYNVIGIEVDKVDFMYFKNKDLLTTTNNELANLVTKNNDRDAIIIDMNNSTVAAGLVQDIIYLMEPSVIRLNRLMRVKPRVFKELEGKRIVLNQSVLSSKDVLELEYEARTKFFFNMPPLNEREKDIPIVDTFLVKLGFTKQQNENFEKKKKILGIFN